ncbi:Uncharacterized protein OBRU01_12033 [Operophtera brumata]|uniref:Uncharacterized protein n=1 Tax=Operophtera brumata TaxID=104452 RepID=A0A0L7LBI7_OPEBR|nr:Uncharacterized protein OBRU01_12033 [Operophtera brumata]
MTKELSAKRKVDKCRDTHPLARRAEGVLWRPMGVAGRASAPDHWPRVGGARPAPSSRLALIELGLSFDFEWGERAVLHAGKNYHRLPIPSVIGIIQYSPGSSNYAAVSFGAAPFVTGRTRPARRGGHAGSPCFEYSITHVRAGEIAGAVRDGVRVPERRRRRVRRRLPGRGRRRAVVGRASLVRADVAGGLPLPGHALPAAAAAMHAPAGRRHEEPPYISTFHELAT